MEILKFELYGNFAHFKKPTILSVSSSERKLSYSQLTPVALKGILGAILGYSGLSKAIKKSEPIEFLDKLKDLHYAILPKNYRFQKEICKISNTTGFANKPSGDFGVNNLMEFENIVNPSWTIYISDTFNDFNKLKEMMLSNKTTYPIKLGKNTFNGVYSDVKVLTIDEFNKNSNTELDNYIPTEYIQYKEIIQNPLVKKIFIEDSYFEKLPIGYSKEMTYIYSNFIKSNREISQLSDSLLIFNDFEIDKTIALFKK